MYKRECTMPREGIYEESMCVKEGTMYACKRRCKYMYVKEGTYIGQAQGGYLPILYNP